MPLERDRAENLFESSQATTRDEAGLPGSSDTGSESVRAEFDEPAPTGGKRLRIILLIANLALVVICHMVAAAVMQRPFGISQPHSLQTFLIGICQFLQIAPLLVATVLLAWGPWRPIVRATLYLLAVVGFMGLLQAWNLDFDLPRISASAGMVDLVNSVFSWLVVMVPAAFCLVLVGSWLRLRIGPPQHEPIRVTILAVMIATGLLGIVITGKNASSLASFSSTVDGGAGPSTRSDNRARVLMQAAIAGPIVAVVLGCIVAAAYRWWARLVVLAMIGGYGGLACYMAMQSAPQFPRGQPNILFLLYSGLLLGIAGGCLWIVLNIRCLDQSGWPCSRRGRGATATHCPPVARNDSSS